MNKKIFLSLIICLAFVLRIAFVNLVPPSLNWDEVSLGYNAYSILHTGKDEWGQAFPTIFRAYGDYKLPGYVYTAVPFVAALGLTPLSVRLPSILAGTLSVFFVYLLCLQLFSRHPYAQVIAFLSALLIAVEPWDLVLSRAALEANLALFLVISGFYFWLLGLTKKSKYLLLSAILLGLSVWTYNSTRIFVPLALIVFSVLYLKNWILLLKHKRIHVFIYVLLIALFIVPMMAQLFNPEGQARYSALRIVDDGAIAQIVESRQRSKLPEPLPRLIHNKATYFVVQFAKSWANHFSPSFLFINGGDHYQFSVQGRGLLSIVNMPFVLIGLVICFVGIRRQKSYQFLLLWLAISPVASSITRDSPHVLRSIVMLPAPMVLSAIGLVFVFAKLQKYKTGLATLFMFGYLVALMLIFADFAETYATRYRTSYSWSWQYGYEQSVSYVKAHYSLYDSIIVTKKYGEPHEFFLFYWPWNSAAYDHDPNLIRFAQSNWWWVDRFDKLYFVNDWQVSDSPSSFALESGGKVDCTKKKSCLLLTSEDNYPIGWKLLETIYFLDGKVAFEIYENK